MNTWAVEELLYIIFYLLSFLWLKENYLGLTAGFEN